MKNWKAASTALLLLATTTVPALATSPVTPSYVPIHVTHALPQAINLEGKQVTYDQQPFIQGGALYLPLRFIVEAAGGTVEWDGAQQQVTADMLGRTAIFTIGKAEAELNQRGVFYIRPNIIALAEPVIIVGGRTMVSADALTQILGLAEANDGDANLDLISEAKVQGPVDPPSGKVKGGEAQVTPRAVGQAVLPTELQTWAAGQSEVQEAAYKVVVTADGSYVGMAGGLKPSGGYRIELAGDARLVDGTWYLEARVVPPTEGATGALTNPIAFFYLPGVTGTIQVNFWQNGATP